MQHERQLEHDILFSRICKTEATRSFLDYDTNYINIMPLALMLKTMNIDVSATPIFLRRNCFFRAAQFGLSNSSVKFRITMTEWLRLPWQHCELPLAHIVRCI